MDTAEGVGPTSRVVPAVRRGGRRLLPALGALVAAGHDIAATYTQPPRPAGDPTPLPYLADAAKQMAEQDGCWGVPFGPITVPDGNVFAMGDNRTMSRDSRFHIEDELQGTIPKADIRGKVVAVIYPFSRWQTVDAINPQQG